MNKPTKIIRYDDNTIGVYYGKQNLTIVRQDDFCLKYKEVYEFTGEKEKVLGSFNKYKTALILGKILKMAKTFLQVGILVIIVNYISTIEINSTLTFIWGVAIAMILDILFGT